MRIAIVGTGISGLIVVHHLHRRHDVTVFEADDRPGGHTNTVEVDLADGTRASTPDSSSSTSTTYPGFNKLLGELGVATAAERHGLLGHRIERTGLV